jgi:elongation factor Tu
MFLLLWTKVKGDNVGILLRGTKREDVQRGQVLCKPVRSSPTPTSGEIYVLSRRRWPSHAFLQQLPSQFYFRDGRDRCDPVARRQEDGDAWRQCDHCELINPIAMEEGLRFAVSAKVGRTVSASNLLRSLLN